ncbi:hypothetical protein C8J34_1413 [Rhizobium sp. PP-F2F-G36]|nr:hypothetical protein C8J34_1413 [Rhizobium sp. PP-F2F-G36]
MSAAAAGKRCVGGMPPELRNHRIPTGPETPASTAASSLDRPAATPCQNRHRFSRCHNGGRPVADNLRRVERSDLRFPVTINTSCLGVLRRPVESALNGAIRVMHKAATMSGTPIMKSLLQGIEDKASMRRPARPPSNDATSKDVDDKGHVDKTLPCGDVGEVRNPQPVWCWAFELAVNPVKRAWSRLV